MYGRPGVFAGSVVLDFAVADVIVVVVALAAVAVLAAAASVVALPRRVVADAHGTTLVVAVELK